MSPITRRRPRVVGQVFPWDLADGGGRRAEAWRELGVDDVAVALYYHAVRAVRWGSDGSPRVVTQDASALYVPFIAGASGRATIVPGRPSMLAPDVGVTAVEVARAAGLGTRAWVAPTHRDGPADEERRYLAVDAWGNRSAHALCPSHPEVRDFGCDVVRNVHETTGVTDFLVESVAGLGLAHASAHDKVPFAWLGPAWEELMSLCFCDGCRHVGERLGIDLAEVGSAARASLRSEPGGSRVGDLVRDVRALRRVIADTFLTELVEVAEALGGRVTVAATTDEQSCSAYAPVTLGPDGPATGCAHLSAPGGRGWEDVRAWRSLGARAAGVVDMLPPHSSLAGALSAACGEPPVHLLDELYLYHLGQRRPDTLDGLRIDEAVTDDSSRRGIT